MLISEKIFYRLRDKIRFYHACYRREQKGKCTYSVCDCSPELINNIPFIRMEIKNDKTGNEFMVKSIPKCIGTDDKLFINKKVVFKQSKNQEFRDMFLDCNNKIVNVITNKESILMKDSKYLIYKLNTGKFMFVSDSPVTKWIGGNQGLHICQTYIFRDGSLEARTYQLRNKSKEIIKEYTIEEIV